MDRGSDQAQYDKLWKHPPLRNERWLPATVVFGEGIFLELDETALSKWESREEVIARAKAMEANDNRAGGLAFRPREITPRLILLHTLSHLIINRLSYEAGYSAASLGERLYVSPGDEPMAGVLIYTAA